MNPSPPLATDLPTLERALAALSGAPLVVHHFATWCDPCEEELPVLAGLLAAAAPAVRTVAIAWDLFMAPVAPAEAGRAVAGFLARLGARFDQVFVYTGTPDDLFSSQRIASGTVPYTEVRAAGGRPVATFDGPILEDAERARFAAALAAAPAGGNS